jgi:uncharacterized protein with HEPN domain
MNNLDRIRLQHMLDAAQEALLFAQGRSRDDLESDRMLVLAIVKSIEIIGEAANQVSDVTQAAHTSIPWGAIVAMRNRLIHGYFDINLDIVWSTVDRELPPLIRQLEFVLAKQ